MLNWVRATIPPKFSQIPSQHTRFIHDPQGRSRSLGRVEQAQKQSRIIWIAAKIGIDEIAPKIYRRERIR